MVLRATSLLLLFLCSALLLTACGHVSTAQAPIATSTTAPTITPSPQRPALTLNMHCPDLTKDGFVSTITHGRVCVSTQPGAYLTIAVTYCVGFNAPDQSPALQGSFQANSAGYYEWNWTPQAPQANCAQGNIYSSGSAAVTAQWRGQTGTAGESFQFG